MCSHGCPASISAVHGATLHFSATTLRTEQRRRRISLMVTHAKASTKLHTYDMLGGVIETSRPECDVIINRDWTDHDTKQHKEGKEPKWSDHQHIVATTMNCYNAFFPLCAWPACMNLPTRNLCAWQRCFFARNSCQNTACHVTVHWVLEQSQLKKRPQRALREASMQQGDTAWLSHRCLQECWQLWTSVCSEFFTFSKPSASHPLPIALRKARHCRKSHTTKAACNTANWRWD